MKARLTYADGKIIELNLKAWLPFRYATYGGVTFERTRMGGEIDDYNEVKSSLRMEDYKIEHVPTSS